MPRHVTRSARPRPMLAALWLAFLAAGVPTAAGSAEPHRTALVIGNSDYAGLPPLPYCGASANVVSAALKRAGFEVTDRRNLSNGAMGVALGDQEDSIAHDPGAVVVTYVCGYAQAYDGRVFLLPASAVLQRPADVLTQGVVTGSLTNALVRADIHAGLLLLDNTAPPGRDAPLDLEHLVNPAALGNKGFAATDSTRPLPDGATPLATAFLAGLAPEQIELRAMLAGIRDALRGTPNLAAVVYAPDSLAWLRGEPPPQAVASPAAAPSAGPPAAAPSAAPPVAPPAAPPAATVSPPVAAATDAESAGPPDRPAMLSDADRRAAQTALMKLGYYTGTADGIFGPETLAAIRRFQHELKSDMTGQLSVSQYIRLLRDSH